MFSDITNLKVLKAQQLLLFICFFSYFLLDFKNILIKNIILPISFLLLPPCLSPLKKSMLTYLRNYIFKDLLWLFLIPCVYCVCQVCTCEWRCPQRSDLFVEEFTGNCDSTWVQGIKLRMLQQRYIRYSSLNHLSGVDMKNS